MAGNATRKPKTQPEMETAVTEETDFRHRKAGYDAQDSFEHGERFRSSRSQWKSSFFAFPLIIEGTTEKHCNGAAYFLTFSLIIEGTTEKALQIIMPL